MPSLAGGGELENKAACDAQRECGRYPRQEGVDVPRIHVIELVVDDQRATGQPQHGHADRQERHVVERHDREDAGLDDLDGQDRQAEQEHAGHECERVAIGACHFLYSSMILQPLMRLISLPGCRAGRWRLTGRHGTARRLVGPAGFEPAT